MTAAGRPHRPLHPASAVVHVLSKAVWKAGLPGVKWHAMSGLSRLRADAACLTGTQRVDGHLALSRGRRVHPCGGAQQHLRVVMREA